MAATMHSTTFTTTHAAKDYLPALARLLLCSLFIWDGVVQLRDPAGTMTYFTSLHIPAPQITVWVSIAVHLLGALANAKEFQAIIGHDVSHGALPIEPLDGDLGK